MTPRADPSSLLRVGALAWRSLVVLALAPLLGASAWAAVGVGLRVVDEMAPPGGLAVVYIELTEPKPLSSGRVRFAYGGGGPLLEVLGVSLLDAVGQVQANLISTDQGAVVEFVSSTATFGTGLDLPIMAVAISVNPAAQPGQTIPVSLDLSDSFFLDAQGQPYPEEVQQGTFTVGGVSITDMEPSGGTVPSGGTIRFNGVGFEAGFDLRIDEATISSTRLAGPGVIEATLSSSFQIRPTTRIRLRNPSGPEDLFFPAVVSRSGGGNGPPVAMDDSASTLEDVPLVIAVLENDSDPDGDPLTVTGLTQPQHGTVTLTATNSVRYVPDPDFSGLDQFTYTANDGRGGTTTATVRVTVAPVNDAPEAVADLFETAPDQAIEIAPLDNDVDADGDSLSLLEVGPATHGIVFAAAAGNVFYFPEPLFAGTDQFEYQVGDGQGGVATGSVTINVQIPELPPLASDDLSSGAAGTMQTIPILDNDSDPNGTPLTLVQVDQPAHGLVETLSDGRISYQPNGGFAGLEVFQYTVRDGAGLSTNAKVAVTVNSINGPLHFVGEPRRLLKGSSADVVAMLSEPASADLEIPLASSDPDLLHVPASVTVPAGSNQARFRIHGLGEGTAAVESAFGGGFAGLPVTVRKGTVLEIPAQGLEDGNPGPRAEAGGKSPLSLGLALANRSPEEAVVQLRAFSDAPVEGEAVIDFQTVLGPYQQTSRSIGEYAPELADFEGWIEVSSFNPAVSALFLNFNSQLRGLAGTSTTAPSSFFVLHCPGLDGTDDFNFSLINNSFEPAQVGIEFRGGGPDIIADVVLEPQGIGVFGGLFAPKCPGVVTIDSSHPLAAYQQVSTPDHLLGQRPPSIVNESLRLFVPQFVSGQGWFTNVSLTNRGLGSTVKFTFLSDELQRTVQLDLPPGETGTFSDRDIFDFDPSQLRVGSLEIETSGDVAGSAVLGRGGADKIAAATGVFPVATNVAIFPQAASGSFQGVDFFTGLALQNTSSLENFVVIDVFSSDGAFRGWGSLRLGPKERIDKLLDELVPGLGTLGAGHVRVRSTQPLVALEMFGDLQLNFLATVVPAPPPGD